MDLLQAYREGFCDGILGRVGKCSYDDYSNRWREYWRGFLDGRVKRSEYGIDVMFEKKKD